MVRRDGPLRTSAARRAPSRSGHAVGSPRLAGTIRGAQRKTKAPRHPCRARGAADALLSVVPRTTSPPGTARWPS
ncbi:hypothetical protein DA2_0632 [Desulfovibrio sp. A2]|nr:hypothetical protein DA2_0632 [Desulfovibrio sp. A2]